jgi:cytochrome c556
MRAHLLISCIPAIALLAVACEQPAETDTADASSSSTPAAAPTAAPAAAPAAAPTAAADPAPDADEAMERAMAAVALRQAPMKLLSWNFGPVAGMLRGAPFDAAVVETNTTRMAQVATMIPGVFVTDLRGTDVDTRSLDAIWGNKADFDMKAMALVDAANAAAAAAATGDEAATMAAVGAMGQTCGGCHDDYRAE